MLRHMLRAQNGESYSREPQALNGKPVLARRRMSLEWMPAARYQPLWRKMPAFALPAFYDGRIRVNLQGRERNGLVPLETYEIRCKEIMQMLNDCRDPFSGKNVVDDVEWPGRDDPLDLAASQSRFECELEEQPSLLAASRFGPSWAGAFPADWWPYGTLWNGIPKIRRCCAWRLRNKELV